MTAQESPARRHYILGVLTLVFTVQMVDKILPGILLPYIKADLELSDTQLGLLVGPAFAVVFALSGLPLAALADRSSKRTIVGSAVLIWSIMTSATGAVSSYAAMLALRFGVGVGEAGCAPASQSIIAEQFPPAERATAMGIYYWGTSFGAFIAFAGGGAIAEYLSWRHAFLMAGIPGMFLSLLVFITLPASRATTVPTRRIPVRSAVRYLTGHRTYVYLLIGAGITNVAYAGGLQWMTSFYLRSYGLGTAQTGLWLAVVSGVIATVGLYLGGWLADRLSRRDARWYMWVSAAGLCVAAPIIPLVFLVDDVVLSFGLFGIAWFGVAVGIAPNYAIAQSLAPPTMRAMSAAILILVVNLLGSGGGPQIIGVVSDALMLEFGQEALRYSLIIVMGPCTILAALAFAAGGISLKTDFATVAKDAATETATAN